MSVKTQKTRLFHDDGASGWTHVPFVTKIAFPVREGTEIDVTHLDSDGMEYMKGLVDLGTLSIELDLVASNTVHQGLIALDISGVQKTWKIEFPESPDDQVITVATSTFDAYVNGLAGDNGVNDKQSRTMNLRTSGDYIPAFGQAREAI